MNISKRLFCLLAWLLISIGLLSLPNDINADVSAAGLTSSQRIVSAGGSITEILFALGANQQNQHKIVATDTSSSFPQTVQTLPKVGYYRQLSVEGVLSVTPSTILAAKGAGPAKVLDQLTQTGVEVVIFEQPKTVKGLLSLITQVGEQVGQSEKAMQLNHSLRSQLTSLNKQKLKQHLPVVFLMSASQRGLMVAGGNTVPHLIMELAGVTNPYARLEGFKSISVESLLETAPKHILIAAHTTDGLSAQEMCQQPVLKLWAATQGCNVHLVDSLLFLGMTPRLPKAVQTFISLVAPQQQVAAK